MDAVSVIKNNMDAEKILDYYNIQHKYFGDFIRCCCPIHNGNNETAFVVNKDFLWYCHTGDCGKGDVFHFIEAMEDVDFPQAVKIAAQILGIDIDNLVIAERKNDYVKELEKFLRYIKSKKKEQKEYDEYVPKADLQSVRQFRSFKEETLRHFGLMYAKEIEIEKKSGGEFKLYERLVIPIYKDDVKIGCSLRKIRATDTPKWFHIPHTMETGEILYNIEKCKEHKEIIVCEGLFDVWKWYEAGFENAVCTFGAHLTETQYRMLLRTGKDIVWSYDGDEAGLNATKKAIQMFKWKVNQWVVTMPDGKDPASLTTNELNDLYLKRERIL